MAVFIEARTDAFEQSRTETAANIRAYGRDSYPVRRPFRGIQIKKDTYAVLRIMGSDGQFIPVIDAAGELYEQGEGTATTTYYSNFIVTNVSDETLPPGIVVISVPILEGTQFVPSSATPSSDELLTEFSADGGMTFAENNVFIGLGDDRSIADPTAYTTVRWTVLVDMEPEDELTLVYRVTIR